MIQSRAIKFIFAVLILMIAILALTSPVDAGGWVVITLDQLPTHVIAGQPYQLGMMARQHGQTPWKVSELRIEAKQPDSGQAAIYFAKPDQQPGHYTVELLFSEPGRWEWGIQSGLYPTLQPMPAIEVTSSVTGTTAGTTATSTSMSLLLSNVDIRMLVILVLLPLGAGVALLIRYRKQKTLRYIGVGLSVLAGLFMVALFSTANAQAGRAQPIPVSGTGTDPTIGQQLFLAKGCVVCHVNNRAIANAETYSVSVGPDLSAYQNDPEYLRQFLAHPKGPENMFPMPDLGLSMTEIDALIHFLNARPAK